MTKTREKQGTPAVRTKTAEGIQTIMIDRPQARNALDHATVAALRSAVEDATVDDAVRCVVLTGPEGAFCAGADLKEVSSHLDADPTDWFRRTVDDLHATIRLLHEGPKPVVTAIGGPVAGGGLGLALSGDVRIASTDASFRSAYLRIGLSPDGASTYFLERLLGLAEAQRFVLLDEPLTAKEAAERGLVHETVPAGDLQSEANAKARRLADLSPESVTAARRLLALAGRQSAADQMEVERDELLRLAASGNAKEGIRAFIEKRPPEFQ